METKVHVHFKFAHMLKLFKTQILLMFSASWHDGPLINSMPMDLLNVTEDSSLCNLTPMNLLSAKDRLPLEREERASARLQHQCQREQEQRQSEQNKVRQARLDRWHVHSEESSVTFSRSIDVGLDSEGSIVSTCALNFEDVTSLISDIIFLYQLAQVTPHNVFNIFQ